MSLNPRDYGGPKQVSVPREGTYSSKGINNFKAMEAKQLSLVSNLVITLKFEAFDFKKHNGTTIAIANIRMCYKKMAKYETKEKLLIHYFKDNLTKAIAQQDIEIDRAMI